MPRMLSWSDPGKTGGVFVLSGPGGLTANIEQSGRRTDGSKRYTAKEALDGYVFIPVAERDLEVAKDNAELAIYLRAKELVPLLEKYM